MSRPMPRLFLIRHGQTEWSQNGRHTGKSDIPLTQKGEEIILQRREQVVGEGKLIDPANLCTVFVSPRQRAHKTFHLLFDHLPKLPDHIISPLCAEWDYGDYEGLKSSEIHEKNPGWDIWRDGCPGGESVADMTARVDEVIRRVKEYHRRYKLEGTGSRDVVIVAHGHFNRVLIARWINFPLHLGTHFNFEPSGVAYLAYNHDNLDEPALNGLNLYAH